MFSFHSGGNEMISYTHSPCYPLNPSQVPFFVGKPATGSFYFSSFPVPTMSFFACVLYGAVSGIATAGVLNVFNIDTSYVKYAEHGAILGATYSVCRAILKLKSFAITFTFYDDDE